MPQTLSYQSIDPVDPNTQRWRGLVRLLGIACIAFGTLGFMSLGVSLRFANRADPFSRAAATLLLPMTPAGWFQMDHLPNQLWDWLLLLVMPVHLTSRALLIAGGVGCVIFRPALRRLLFWGLIGILLSQLIVSIAFPLSQILRDLGRSRITGALWAWYVAITVAPSVLSTLERMILPALLLILITRPAIIEVLERQTLWAMPRALTVLTSLALTAGALGIGAHTLAFLAPSSASHPQYFDAGLGLWQIATQSGLWLASLAMVIGSLAVLRLHDWGRRLLAGQALVGLTINGANLGLLLIMTFWWRPAGKSGSNVAIGICLAALIQLMSMALDVATYLYFRRRDIAAAFQAGRSPLRQPVEALEPSPPTPLAG